MGPGGESPPGPFCARFFGSAAGAEETLLISGSEEPSGPAPLIDGGSETVFLGSAAGAEETLLSAGSEEPAWAAPLIGGA